MALGSAHPKTGGNRGASERRPQVGRGPWRAATRRRRAPFAALGGLLVIVCVLGFAYGATRLSDRIEVLAVGRAVAAGQVLSEVDLMTVTAAEDSRVNLVAAADLNEVVGRTAVVPLLAGTLLTPVLVGDSAFPPAGQVVASVALTPGRYPQGLSAGANVLVYLAAESDGEVGQATGATSSESLGAVVVGVDLDGDGQGSTVITLLLYRADADSLAVASNDAITLMRCAGGDG